MADVAVEPVTTAPKSASPELQSPVDPTLDQDDAPAPAVQDPKSAIAARMARFKSLQVQKSKGVKDTTQAVAEERRKAEQPATLNAKIDKVSDRAKFKLLRADEGENFERKRAWDWTVQESENWDEHVAKKKKNKDNNSFDNYAQQAATHYDHQVKQMGKVDQEDYALAKAERIQKQLKSGILILRDNEFGEPEAYNPITQQVNTPADEDYMNHKDSKENVDKIVAWEEKREQNRLEARRKRMGRDDDSGDVTYINEKNKQFNNKLSRFYNKYTKEIRDNFERGTAI